MFSETGDYLLSDVDNVWDGWDIEEVVKSGARHDADPEDLNGCLFFHLRDQFIECSRRLKLFKIRFILYSQHLASIGFLLGSPLQEIQALHRGFDRVEVTDRADDGHQGIGGFKLIAKSFAQILDPANKHATLLVTLMDWAYECDAFVDQEGRNRTKALECVDEKVRPFIALLFCAIY
jgi:hypothetical protein